MRAIEDAILALQVGMQHDLLEVAQQDAAGTVHDAIRQALRCRRIRDVERMVERQCDVFGCRIAFADELRPAEHRAWAARRGCAAVRDHDQLRDAGHSVEDRVQCVQAIATFAVVEAGVGGEQQLRSDLAEAFDHGMRIEVWRAGRPDRTERTRRQHRDDRLGDVGQHSGDVIADADAGSLQRLRETTDLRMQLRVADLALLAAFVAERDRGAFVPEAQQVLREVQGDVREPAGARHPVAIDQHRFVLAMAATLLEQQRLKREFDLARRLQKSLLPKRRRDNFPVIGVNRPAHEISGDFYDHFELADGRVGFVVGDISGKGLDAALLMVRAASLLRWAGKDGIAPAAWLARANDELCETTQDGRFVCALVGYCDRAATHVQFAGAGFPPVIVQQGGAFADYPSGGPPLGILPGVAFEEHRVELAGGTLYAFSDGATDVRDDAGRPIGNAGVRALIARHVGAA